MQLDLNYDITVAFAMDSCLNEWSQLVRTYNVIDVSVSISGAQQ